MWPPLHDVGSRFYAVDCMLRTQDQEAGEEMQKTYRPGTYGTQWVALANRSDGVRFGFLERSETLQRCTLGMRRKRKVQSRGVTLGLLVTVRNTGFEPGNRARTLGGGWKAAPKKTSFCLCAAKESRNEAFNRHFLPLYPHTLCIQKKCSATDGDETLLRTRLQPWAAW